MSQGRTFAIGDIHGDLAALTAVLGKLPPLTAADTLVFLGDYVDRGPQSAQVVARLRALPAEVPSRVITLRGNHEDAWLQVVERGWPEFVMPRGNGCLETMRSYTGRDVAASDAGLDPDEYDDLFRGAFWPADVLAWMRTLPYWYEDEHAIYVHAGIKRTDGAFPHPSVVEPQRALLWLRDRDFFENYRGKLVVFGHTNTGALPPELSTHTPDDPEDLWAGPGCVGLDTRCGKGGYLTALELPARTVYESR